MNDIKGVSDCASILGENEAGHKLVIGMNNSADVFLFGIIINTQ